MKTIGELIPYDNWVPVLRGVSDNVYSLVWKHIERPVWRSISRDIAESVKSELLNEEEIREEN